MKLVACSQCHAQYDLATWPGGEQFACRCGAKIEAKPPKPSADAAARRCGACGALASLDAEQCAFCGSGLAAPPDPGSLICPECFARNADAARFCAGCGVAFAPQAIPVEAEAGVHCPCCDRQLGAREVGGVVVFECGKCQGLWAPSDGFDQLVERAATAARTRLAAGDVPDPRVDRGNPYESRVEYRRCPICREQMARRNYQKKSGIIIDQCHAHGIWLDAHELERIAGFILSGKAQRVVDARRELERAQLSREARNAELRVKDRAAERDDSATGPSGIAGLVLDSPIGLGAGNPVLDLIKSILD